MPSNIPRYIPVAEYEIGICHYERTIPYKTVRVTADSMAEAMNKGHKELKPSQVQHVRHVATRPNPEYVASRHSDIASRD